MTTRRETGTGYLFRRGEVWWAQVRFEGKRSRFSTDTSDEVEARKILRAKIKESHKGTLRAEGQPTFDELIANLVANYAANGHKSLRYRDDRPTVGDSRLREFFAGEKISRITTSRLRDFVLYMQEQGLTNATVNRSLALLRRAFKIAVEDGRVAKASVPHFPMVSEAGNARKGFLAIDDYRRLIVRLPDWLGAVVAIAYNTGMRRSEVMTLRWDHCDLVRNVVTIDPGAAKNGKGRSVPITGELAAILKERRAALNKTKNPRFDSVAWRADAQGNPLPVIEFRELWEKACVACGLGRFEPVLDSGGTPVIEKRCDRRKGAGKPKLAYRGLIFHDLRRSCVRNLVNSGVREADCMAITGHLTREVFDRYNIRSGDDLATAGKRLGQHLEQNGHIPATISTPTADGSKSIN
jgi:integrase